MIILLQRLFPGTHGIRFMTPHEDIFEEKTILYYYVWRIIYRIPLFLSINHYMLCSINSERVIFFNKSMSSSMLNVSCALPFSVYTTLSIHVLKNCFFSTFLVSYQLPI